MPQNWEALRYDDTASGTGALLSQNTRYYVDGELQRRPAMVAVNVGALSQALGFVTLGDLLGRQYVIIVNALGTMESVAV